MSTTSTANTRTYSWVQAWLASFFAPTVHTFKNLSGDPRDGLGRAFAWAFLGSLGTSLAAVILLLVTGSVAGLELFKNPETLPSARVILAASVALLPLAAAGGILGLLANTAIAHLIARVGGGKGSFRRLTYAMSTYLVPAALFSTALSLIPAVGAVSLLVEVYTVYLDTAAIKAVHRISWGGSFLAALVPFVLSIAIKAGLLLTAALLLLGAGKWFPGLAGS